MQQVLHELPKFFQELPGTAEEATYTCLFCGVMEPKRLTFHGVVRYARKPCACKQRAHQQEERASHLHLVYSSNNRRAYTWLGDRWSDLDLQTRTFQTFNAHYQREAYEAVRSFADEPEGTLVLHGTYGTGKTHLLAALCNACQPALFTTSPNLFAALQDAIATKEDYMRFIAAAIRTPLLIIDDIDKAKWSEFREEMYFEIIDKRVRAGQPLAISTNKLAELEKYVGGAVCSRLKVGQIAVEMVGADFREEI